jgi:hypothetical protein
MKKTKEEIQTLAKRRKTVNVRMDEDELQDYKVYKRSKKQAQREVRYEEH